MRIGVLGTGTMGRAVARMFARAGHDVRIGSRNPERAADVARELGGIHGGSWADAAAHGEVVTLALAWEHVQAALGAAGSLRDRVVLDCSNPESEDGRSLVVGLRDSGAETIARAAAGARVVKALNHVYAEVLDAGPCFDGRPATAFLCGDHRDANLVIGALLGQCGFDVVDAGPLRVARFLEPAAMLMVSLVRAQKLGAANVALGLLRRGGVHDSTGRIAPDRAFVAHQPVR